MLFCTFFPTGLASRAQPKADRRGRWGKAIFLGGCSWRQIWVQSARGLDRFLSVRDFTNNFYVVFQTNQEPDYFAGNS
jgi:hypothetical protein